jgi:hypothetical protein
MFLRPQRVRIPRQTIRWLLEKTEPSVRYYTLTRLIRKSEEDADVRATKAREAGMGGEDPGPPEGANLVGQPISLLYSKVHVLRLGEERTLQLE